MLISLSCSDLLLIWTFCLLRILKAKTSGVNDVNRKKNNLQEDGGPEVETKTVEHVQVTVQDIVKTRNIASDSVLKSLKCQSDYYKVCTEQTLHILTVKN